MYFADSEAADKRNLRSGRVISRQVYSHNASEITKKYVFSDEKFVKMVFSMWKTQFSREIRNFKLVNQLSLI